MSLRTIELILASIDVTSRSVEQRIGRQNQFVLLTYDFIYSFDLQLEIGTGKSKTLFGTASGPRE